MKWFRRVFTCSLLMLTLSCVNVWSEDSIRVSLVTCGPGNEVWSHFGHSALHYQDVSRNIDIAVNYGLFSLNSDHFIWRFIMGTADYEMGIADFNRFLDSYAAEGRWVKEQELNLTNDEKQAIAQAIDLNFRPENRAYRYNYFYDNCTTRARNIIESNIKGDVRCSGEDVQDVTLRDMVHQAIGTDRWTRFGIDLLIGVMADQPTDRRTRQFLPDSLASSYDHAVIIENDTTTRQLVTSEQQLVTIENQSEKPTKNLFTPLFVMSLLAVLILLITFFERYKNKFSYLTDFLILTITGLAGLILFLLIFSKHCCVSLNFQILMLCPLNVFFAYFVAKRTKKHQNHPWLKIWCAMILLMLILGFWQQYAEGIYVLASSLLVRYLLRFFGRTKENA